MKKKQRSIAKLSFIYLAIFTLFVPGNLAFIPTPSVSAGTDSSTITFQRNENNMPIFDGEKEHLDAFVNLILSEMSIEDLAYYADQKSAGEPRTIEGGYMLPGTAAGGVDRVTGVSTDFPSMVSLGQTWNKELLKDVGTVIGNERRGEVTVNDPNTLMFSIVADMRINPLSGRFEEGYAEDPVLAGTLINEMAEGITGFGEEGNEDGFWLKTQLGTKHFTNYLAQWYRGNGQFYVGARALNEYQMKSFLYPLESGLVTSLMTTYGRTNGIPNHISPNIIRATNANPYSMMPVGDFIQADLNMTEGFNNGYQNYTDADGSAALLLLSGNHANTFSSNYSNLINAVESNIFGVARKELEDSVRGQIEMWVRTGYFNEKKEDGSPKEYPFTNLAKDRNPVNYATEEHQSIALDAARESIVLLKNEGDVLPLEKDNNIAVTGIFADTRFKATYSVENTPEIDGAGLSPLEAVKGVVGEDQVTYGTGAKIVALESVLNNAVLTAPDTEGQLFASPDTSDVEVGYDANGKTYAENQAFEAYAWGQEGYSYKSFANNKWLNFDDSETYKVSNDDDTSLNMAENTFTNTSDGSTLPGRFRRELNEDNTISLITGSYLESYGGGFETAYYNQGRFVTVNSENGGIEVSGDTLGNAAGAAERTVTEKFNEVVLKEAGADAEVWAAGNDYAVVVVGTPARHSSGEGADRADLKLGEDQYATIEKVAESFPKKTIVIVKSNSPVAMEQIENNENVASILYQPYAGQYDSKALADVLFGDYAPTGRLSSTWYAGVKSFPTLDRYSLPEGENQLSFEQIDPRFTVDMTNGDPADTDMTYMYTDADVTYEFGFGLGYSEFEYSNLQVPTTSKGNEPFEVTVDVTNTGDIDTEEVVQLYINNEESGYGEYTPEKQLVSYHKAAIPAGETQQVLLTVNPKDFAVWDANRSEYITEKGTYTLMTGSSSENTPLTEKLKYNGETLAKLDATSVPVNVHDVAFAAEDVIYREVSKVRTAEGLKKDLSENGYYAVTSKNKGAWVGIKDVKLSGIKGITLKVASTNSDSFIEVRADAPDGRVLTEVTFDATEAATREVQGSDFEIVELDYQELTEKFTSKPMGGYHDVYLVFGDSDIRVDSIQFNKTGKGSK